jgi:protein-S-isoprenylcysteine O-methyltransferase Ste14
MLNLWIYLVGGYAIIWGLMIWANKKRGAPIADPYLYQDHNREMLLINEHLPLTAMLVVSIFIPTNTGQIFWIGFTVAILGVSLNGIAMIAFSKTRNELNTHGIYQFTRNPMYVGGFLFLVGLNIMGWRPAVVNVVFALLTVYWMITIHLTVLREEAFLQKKYGPVYDVFKRKTPRYIAISGHSCCKVT